MIELAEGVWIDPWSVTMIKKIDDGKCALWTTGQSALEGFILDYSAEQVAEVVNDARNECEEEEDE